MRTIFALLLSVLTSVGASNLPGNLSTNGLVADWGASQGVSLTNSFFVYNWTDQHTNEVNDGNQYIATNYVQYFQPAYCTDSHSIPMISFIYSVNALWETNYLGIPTALTGLDYSNMTIYIVCSGFAYQADFSKTTTLLSLGSFGFGVLEGTSYLKAPRVLQSGSSSSKSSTFYPANNKCVLALRCGPDNLSLWYNHTTNMFSSAGHFLLGAGGVIGSLTNLTLSWIGDIYRLRILAYEPTIATVHADITELTKAYNIVTNFTQKVIMTGDSITSGLNASSNSLASYPYQLMQREPQIQFYTEAVPGWQIGTNGSSGAMWDYDTNRVDTLYDSTYARNYCFEKGGYNDFQSGGFSAAVTFLRMTNYVATRTNAHPWSVVTATLADNPGNHNTTATFNGLVRSNGWITYVDPGLNSPHESRLSDFSNTNMCPDQIHPNQFGYAALADAFRQIINVPRRTTGFFSQ